MLKLTAVLAAIVSLAVTAAPAGAHSHVRGHARPHHARHALHRLSPEDRCLASEGNEWDEYTRADNAEPETLCRPIGKERATPPGVVVTIELPL